jgi:hypothetical protein
VVCYGAQEAMRERERQQGSDERQSGSSCSGARKFWAGRGIPRATVVWRMIRDLGGSTRWMGGREYQIRSDW